MTSPGTNTEGVPGWLASLVLLPKVLVFFPFYKNPFNTEVNFCFSHCQIAEASIQVCCQNQILWEVWWFANTVLLRLAWQWGFQLKTQERMIIWTQTWPRIKGRVSTHARTHWHRLAERCSLYRLGGGAETIRRRWENQTQVTDMRTIRENPTKPRIINLKHKNNTENKTKTRANRQDPWSWHTPQIYLYSSLPVSSHQGV